MLARLSVIVILGLFSFSTPIFAAESLSTAKREKIQVLLETTGALKLADSMMHGAIDQITQMIRRARPDIPESALGVVAAEVGAVVASGMPALVEVMIHLYDKYYTEADVMALLAFYSSPVGRKTIAALPTLSQESMQAGMAWSKALMPEIDRRIRAGIRREGYEL
ncbi:MAG: DUF2059 domain-containing protein [Burkholderiales bacterium]|nr:DUF2059 domain-containing protein [Burkholderiales bacterium]